MAAASRLTATRRAEDAATPLLVIGDPSISPRSFDKSIVVPSPTTANKLVRHNQHPVSSVFRQSTIAKNGVDGTDGGLAPVYFGVWGPVPVLLTVALCTWRSCEETLCRYSFVSRSRPRSSSPNFHSLGILAAHHPDKFPGCDESFSLTKTPASRRDPPSSIRMTLYSTSSTLPQSPRFTDNS